MKMKQQETIIKEVMKRHTMIEMEIIQIAQDMKQQSQFNTSVQNINQQFG